MNWTSCIGLSANKLPEERVLVLLKWGTIDIAQRHWRQGWAPDFWRGNGGEYDLASVTHWMPLPALPDGREGR